MCCCGRRRREQAAKPPNIIRHRFLEYRLYDEFVMEMLRWVLKKMVIICVDDAPRPPYAMLAPRSKQLNVSSNGT